jgi:hypothetical protein
MALEGCQFQSGTKVKAFVAVLSVLSVMLMNVRQALRDARRAGEPVARVVPAAWVAVLRRLKVRSGPVETVGAFCAHLAWLGGYMRDRPDRDPPGWQTLWRGWQRLHAARRYELSTPEM